MDRRRPSLPASHPAACCVLAVCTRGRSDTPMQPSCASSFGVTLRMAASSEARILLLSTQAAMLPSQHIRSSSTDSTQPERRRGSGRDREGRVALPRPRPLPWSMMMMMICGGAFPRRRSGHGERPITRPRDGMVDGYRYWIVRSVAYAFVLSVQSWPLRPSPQLR